VFVLALLLTFAGIALDTGKMYLWRLRLERAARAGVTAGLGYRAVQGWQTIYGGPPQYIGTVGDPKTGSPSSEMLKLVAHAQQVALENLRSTAADSISSSALNALDTEFSTYVKIEPDGNNDGYNPVQDRVQLRLSYEVPTFLIGRLGSIIPISCDKGSGTRCTVTATADAVFAPATIGMILDTSGSMACDDPTDPDCPCRTSAGGCAVGTRKIDQLMDAAMEFIKFFNPFRDRISIVPFNIAADPGYLRILGPPLYANQVVSFGQTPDLYNRVTDKIDRTKGSASMLNPVSNTNHCDALATAIWEINAVANNLNVPVRSLRPFYVFFTDGAPNAMRVSWMNEYIDPISGGRLTAAQNSVVPTLPNQWYQYSIEWKNTTTNVTYRGPSPSVNVVIPPPITEGMFNFLIGSLGPTGVPKYFPNNSKVCGDIWPNAVDFDKALNGGIPVTPATPGCVTPPCNPGCLQDLAPGSAVPADHKGFGFMVPGVSSVVAAADVPYSELYNGVLVPQYDQLHYYCAIEAADYARMQQGAVYYVVGLGPQQPDCNDPLGDSDNAFLRKDNFLARLAFDPVTTKLVAGVNDWDSLYRFSPRRSRVLTNLVAGQECNNPGNKRPPAHRFARLNLGNTMMFGYDDGARGAGRLDGGRTPDELDTNTQGFYYFTDDAAKLRPLFTQIAKSILLRLLK